MEFHWKGQLLPKKEFRAIIGALRSLSKSIYDAPGYGYTDEEGNDWLPVDFILEPSEMEEDAQIINDFLKSLHKGE